MRKIVLCLTLFFLSFIFSARINPIQAQWQKYENNPVVSGNSGDWDQGNIGSPSVIYDNSIYKMWYQAGYQSRPAIGYATSSDGRQWVKHSLPVITPDNFGSGNIQEIAEPTVIKNGTQYQMWLKEFSAEKNKIRYATSSDGISWSLYPSPVLEYSPNAWDDSGPTNPFVLFDGVTYHMWYVANGSSNNWRTGYASSSNGYQWTKSADNPLNLPAPSFTGGMSVLKIENLYHMWYHVGSGGTNISIYHVVSPNINAKTWSCLTTCEEIGRTPNSFDSNHIVSPSVIATDLQLMMWYGGNNGPKWQIGLATYPLPQKNPIVVIPGFFASWNKEAILHNQVVPQSDWKLAPFVKEYDGIISTLKNLGYVENTNLFVFAYDWRQPVEDTSIVFQNYLQQNIFSKNPHQKIDIIGHSLGGIIARIYAQENPNNTIEHLITVGSPHKGTVQVYKAIEAGEIDRSNSLMWLAQKTILMLNKDSFETDKDTINNNIPVLKDMLATYPFLKKPDNSFVSIDSMQLKNNVLLTYNDSETQIFPYLHTMTGNKGNTLLGYTVTERTILDRLLNYYIDGRPQNTLSESGDYIILSSSAGIGNDIVTMQKDHGEIIYQKDSIKQILNKLTITYQENQIVEGNGTKVSPSLIFLIRSPATMTVTINEQQYQENDGVIFIENVQTGNATLTVKGTEKGTYDVLIGQIGENNDLWTTIEGEITKDPPDTQTDTYPLSIDKQSPLPPFSVQSYFNDLVAYLNDIKKTNNIPQITYAINSINQARIIYQNNQKKQLRSALLLAHSYLLVAKNKTSDPTKRNKLSIAFEKIENVYSKSLEGYSQDINVNTIQKTLAAYKELLQKSILKAGSFNKQLAVKINNKIQESEKYLNAQNYTAAEILLKTSEDLIRNGN